GRVTEPGSRCIPHVGQLPHPERTICGCLGQVYSTRLEATGISGSSAIPQRGPGPGFATSTSGHSGQTYFAPGSARGMTGGAGFGPEVFANAGPMLTICVLVSDREPEER